MKDVTRLKGTKEECRCEFPNSIHKISQYPESHRNRLELEEYS